MSKIAGDILDLIKKDPKRFAMKGNDPFCGITDGNIDIIHFGNTRALSVIDVCVNGVEMRLTYIDRWRIEVAMKKWFKQMSLEHFLKLENRDK